MNLKRSLLLEAAASFAFAGSANAEDPVKIGVMSDMSGLYADLSGPG